MSLTRRFLPQSRPALHSAAELLLRLPNLPYAIVAVPAARAARRLADVLAWFHQQSGATATLTLPKIVTAGELPERLMRPAGLPIATQSEALAARAGALRAMGAEALRCVFPVAPEPGDAGGWLRLARELEALDEELSGERVGYGQVAEYCATHAPRGESERWRALERVDALARERLRAAGTVHRSEARLAALENDGDGLRRGLTVALVGTVDLPGLAAEMVRRVARYSECIALVFAPESDEDGFDDVGRLIAGYWPAKSPALAAGQLRIVASPREQGYAVLEQAGGRLAGLADEQITVALGDAALGGAVERSLIAGGRRTHREMAARLASSGPVTLLQALADYAEGWSAASWAALSRHPDLAAYLASLWGNPAEAACLPERSDTLRVLSLPARADAPAPPTLVRKHDKGSLQAKAVGAVASLLDASADGGNLRAAHPLSHWAEPITRLLTETYSGREFHAESPGDAAPIQALQALGRRLRELAAIPDSLRGEMGAFTLPQAMRWVASQVAAEPVLAPRADGGCGAIEITGWLDALLDDAPALIVAGFNEGAIPETLPGDGLLPEPVRVALELPSNERRLSRDAYTLAALVASRDVTLIAARASSKNEPLAPSRLLFTGADTDGDGSTVVQNALRFYSPDRREQAPVPPDASCADQDALSCLPKPVPPGPPINRLPATAFRDYLACPYRFYLKHVLKLESVNDARVEIEGDLFGTLAHETLNAFGQWVIAQHEGVTPDKAELLEFLNDALTDAAKQRLAPLALPVAAIQVDRLRRRLAAFAAVQTQLASDGWMILYAEQKLDHPLIVDGAPFSVYGRVDRIDYHPETSATRIIDYKTADTPKTPRQSHCPQGTWIDLQLPAYQQIAACLDDAFVSETVECGYLNLPRKAQDAAFEPAVWQTKTAAPPDPAALLAELIRAIRSCLFWPPSETLPAYDDGLAAICLDGALNRAEIIRRGAGLAAVWDGAKKEESL